MSPVRVYLSRYALMGFVALLASASTGTAQTETRSVSGSALAVQNETARARFSVQNELSRFSSAGLRNSVYNQVVPRNSGVAARNLFQLGGGIQPKAKPFSTAKIGGSVSPYLEYSNPFSNAGTTYYTQVRPRQEQQRYQQQVQQQLELQDRRLSASEVRGPYDRAGSERVAPTGHTAVFQYYGTFQNYLDFYRKPRTRPKYK